MTMLLEQFPDEYNRDIQTRIFDGLNNVPAPWRDYFTIEEEVSRNINTHGYSGFAEVPQWPDGADLPQDDAVDVFDSVLAMLYYGMGFKVSRKHVRYGQLRLIRRWADSLARSAAQTYGTQHAAILNGAFTTAYASMGGQTLISATHLTAGGTRSNILFPAAAMTPANVETLIVAMMNWVNYRGLRDPQIPRRLIHPSSLRMMAEKIAKSTFQPTDGVTVTQDSNVQAGMFRNICEYFMTSTTAYFLQSDNHGLLSVHGLYPSPIQYLEESTQSLVQGLEFDFVCAPEYPDGMAGCAGA